MALWGRFSQITKKAPFHSSYPSSVKQQEKHGKDFASQPGASSRFQFPSIRMDFIRSSFNADKKKWKMYKDLSKCKIYRSVSIPIQYYFCTTKKIRKSLWFYGSLGFWGFFPHNFLQLYCFHRVRLSYIVGTMNKSQLEFQVLYFHIGKSISGWGTLSKKVFHRVFWVGRSPQRSSSPVDDLYRRKEIVLFQLMKNFYFWRNPPGHCVMGLFNC